MNSESKIQQEAVMWFRNTFCRVGQTPRCIIFSVPNERSDKFEQMRMVQTGLMSGVSDLVVITPGKVLFIEVKDDKGRQSDKQKAFEQSLRTLGFEYYLVRNLEEFKKIFVYLIN